MKGLLLVDKDTGSDVLIPPPTMPDYSIGTTVIFKNFNTNDEYETMEGIVVGVEFTQELEEKGYMITTDITYRIKVEKTEDYYYAAEEDILEYYPETNEYDIAYHKSKE